MKANICINCKKAAGKCSWSGYDPKAKKLRFEPVPGWTAKPSSLMNGTKEVATYHITACPEFEPDNEEKKCKWCGAPLPFASGRTSFCFDCAPPGEAYQRTINRLKKKLQRRNAYGSAKVPLP